MRRMEKIGLLCPEGKVGLFENTFIRLAKIGALVGQVSFTIMLRTDQESTKQAWQYQLYFFVL